MLLWLQLGQAGVPSVGPPPRARPFGVIPSVGPSGDLIYPEPANEPMEVHLPPNVTSVILQRDPIEEGGVTLQMGPPPAASSAGPVDRDILVGTGVLPNTVYVIRTSEEPRIKDDDLDDEQPPSQGD